jgi:hypothetical protein
VLHHFGNTRSASTYGQFAVRQRQLDVLGYVEVVDGVEALEDEADAASRSVFSCRSFQPATL